MPGAIRQFDIDSSGLVNMGGSPNTFVNNQALVRAGDSRIPVYDAINIGCTILGAEVICNNRHCQYVGHGNMSGSCQCQGSPNVIIN